MIVSQEKNQALIHIIFDKICWIRKIVKTYSIIKWKKNTFSIRIIIIAVCAKTTKWILKTTILERLPNQSDSNNIGNISFIFPSTWKYSIIHKLYLGWYWNFIFNHETRIFTDKPTEHSAKIMRWVEIPNA